MKIAHFSDTHLGYSRYGRTTERGLNQRMVDVVDTFQRVLDSIVQAEAEVVIHAGDFFDKDRPPNLVITTAFKRLVRFQKLREGKPFIVIAGNHDSPKVSGAGNILSIFGEHELTDYSIPGMYVVESNARRISIPDLGFEALALPWRGENTDFALKPEDRRNVCVLVAHGLESSLAVPGATLSLSRMHHTEWDYIALGDYHIRQEIAANAWYSGSTDYTSTNFWEEVQPLPEQARGPRYTLQKGWNLFDSETRNVKFMPVEPVRAPVPLPEIDAAGLSGAEIGDALLRNAHWDENALPIVRQVVRNCDPFARAEVPHEIRSQLQARALFYQLDMFLASKTGTINDAGLPRGATLNDDWQSFAESRDLPPGVGREEFVHTGHRLMKESASDSSED